jgi:V8-like Glu-specific endopeptidase
MRKPQGFFGALIVVACLAPATAGAAPAHDVTRGDDAIRAYWTPERMREALPAEELLADVELPASGTLAPGRGAARTVAPAPRATDVGGNTTDPYRAHGKVFFTLGGSNYVCSGTVVNAISKRLVVTAGHCVAEAENYATNWMFVPGFRDGDRPFGTWTARRLATTKQWYISEDIRYDVGMATMRKNGNGRRIQEVVGARGVAFNRPRDQRYHAYGYPAEGGFSGNRLFMCDSAYQGADGGFGTPAPMRIACDMTGGSSGGGWVVGERVVNSIVSYGYECTGPLGLPLPCDNPEEGKLFGPYFGSSVRKLYRAERRLGRN